MLIRRGLPEDELLVGEIHADAFAPHYLRDAPVEPRLVARLRTGAAWLEPLSLVAVIDGTLAGHVCCTRATLLPAGHPVLGLGPLGVRTRYQHQGVGGALMHAVLGAADALGEPLVALLGHPDYYPRFGFRPAVELGIEPEVAEWAPAFQVRPLHGHRPDLTGRFRYAAPFNEL